MKKITGMLIIVSLLLCGCVQKIEDPAEASAKYPWIIATDSPKDTVTGLFAHKFAEEVESLSNGSIHMEVYENGTLGSDRELIESCMGQDIPFVLQNTAPQTNFMSRLAIFDLPVAYTEIDKLRETLDDPTFMDMINAVYQENGFRLLAMGDQSFRVMTTNKSITNIQDFQGQKIRTMENPYHIAFWQSIGANPTPMTFSEVYIGLQQGTIDAQENPYEVIVSGKIYEQQDYIVQTNHLPHLLSLIVNDDFYRSLNSEQQKIVDTAAENARNYARKQADQRVSDRLDVRNIVIGEGIPKICVPIVGKTKEELLSEVAVLKGSAVDVVEWRMDWFEAVETVQAAVDMLQVLREALPDLPILATFRSKKEGGEREVSTAYYVELNKAIIDCKAADLIDVELFTGEKEVKELIAYAHAAGVRVIMSNHDFDKTPSYHEILTRLQAMQKLDADIPKIAVMPTCKADVLTLLQATNDMHEKFADRPIITMSMAGTGVLSRLCGEVFGSALTFGAAKKASAPGQMGVEDLKTVLTLLHKSL